MKVVTTQFTTLEKHLFITLFNEREMEIVHEL